MIEHPFSFDLTPEELQKLGEMSLTWSHTEHLVGNCLKVLLRLTNDEAIAMVFPLTLEQRVRRIKMLIDLDTANPDVKIAFEELKVFLPAMQLVRNNVVHATLDNDASSGEILFRLKSKDKALTKTEIFSAEEISNYVCCVALSLWLALLNGPLQRPLPGRPAIPSWLLPHIPIRKK
jgi:hypothetical protein